MVNPLNLTTDVEKSLMFATYEIKWVSHFSEFVKKKGTLANLEISTGIS